MLTFLWHQKKMLITFYCKQYIKILCVYNMTNIKNVV